MQQQQFLTRQAVRPTMEAVSVRNIYQDTAYGIQAQSKEMEQRSPLKYDQFQENQNKFQQNIQKIKEEIAQSKLMIETYQKKLQDTSSSPNKANVSRGNSNQASPVEYRAAYQPSQLQDINEKMKEQDTQVG